MSDRFTDSIDPLALAGRGRLIKGTIALSELKRVLPLLRSNSGEVEFSLNFEIDEAGIARVRGKVLTVLLLQCQRCMEDMEYRVHSRVRLGIVPTREAAEQLPENYEPLVCSDEVSIASILEDELILALPIVAMHEKEDCPLSDVLMNQSDGHKELGKDEATAERQNPFAVLAELKGVSSKVTK